MFTGTEPVQGNEIWKRADNMLAVHVFLHGLLIGIAVWGHGPTQAELFTCRGAPRSQKSTSLRGRSCRSLVDDVTYVTARHSQIRSGGGDIVPCALSRPDALADDSAHPVLAHGNAVEGIRYLHSAFLVGDHNELAGFAQVFKDGQ